MTAQQQQQHIQHSYAENICHLDLHLKERKKNSRTFASGDDIDVENIRNCDIFVEDFNLIFYADVRPFRFHSSRQFDINNMKNLIIKYDSNSRCYQLLLPCLPQNEAATDLETQKNNTTVKNELEKKSSKYFLEEYSVDLWKLKRITDNCKLQIDDTVELLKFDANYDYGFARKYKGKIYSDNCNMNEITRLPEPHLVSPLQRTIDREIDELKNFSREQYKLNLVELQVPEGHENPMKYTFNFNDYTLTNDETCLLHNLTCKPEHLHMPDFYDQTEVDCGLVSILLAICYDVRSTANEVTCESGWTRSILSATLYYFEPFDNLKDVVISFLRRTIIYPLYRSYDFARLCVQDAIDALQKSPNWILKQLLLTHEIFQTSDLPREVFNRYYINDYIRYISNEVPCSVTHLQMLAHNLKNVLLDISKKHLHMNLIDIEAELLKELIEDIQLLPAESDGEEETNSYDENDDNDDDEDDDDGSESDDDNEDLTTSASETEENSVIEKRINALHI